MRIQLPNTIDYEAVLDDVLTSPRPELVRFIKTVTSPLLILGAGGKMGPSLAVLARRAAEEANHPLEVIAASRFSDHAAREWLEVRGVRTLVADALEREDLAKLPDADNVIYLVGQKFGTSANPARTWIANTLAPALAAERFRSSRIVALSTANVYPLCRVADGGSREEDPLTPLGEYANAAVARERIFEYYSQQYGTHVALLRLSYALDLRYGVIADIAGKVLRGEPIPLASGYFNAIWQGDANELILRSLDLTASPAAAFNLSGPMLAVREIAEQLGRLLNRAPVLEGEESGTALVCDTRRLESLLGPSATPLEVVLRWTADWVKHGRKSLNKPTHFETRDGTY
ncbi:MAG: NAD(P)-dependent oxidoreductase [Planctomycetales bacterium]|nr:NAD(P)-dependent oxidoreductase [Planctomycetales bacterium]